FVRRADVQSESAQFIGQHSNQERIFCSAARDDEFVLGSLSQHEALQCVGNRPYCQRGSSGHDISGFGTPALFYEFDDKLAAELLAARGLWRLPAEKQLAQDLGYYVFKRSPGSRDFPFAIIWLRGKDRKSTRLNSSHVAISYAVFCLKKKKKNNTSINKNTHEN